MHRRVLVDAPEVIKDNNDDDDDTAASLTFSAGGQLVFTGEQNVLN